MSTGLSVVMCTGDFYPGQIGGQGIYAYEVSRRIAAAGVKVRIVCPSTPERVDWSPPKNLTTLLLPANTKNPLHFSWQTLKLRKSILADTTILHVNELFGFPLAWTRPTATRLVISSHNAYLDRFRAARMSAKLKYPPLIALERLTYARAERLIIGSEIERQPMHELGVDNEKIVAIPYGVEAEKFVDRDGSRRQSIRQQLNIPENAQVVLYVARFVERKKPHVVAQAALKLRTNNPSLHVIMIGDGDMMASVKSIIGNNPGIHAVGAISFADLPKYYAAADVFTLPSVGEGSISLVVLEAAAAGLPLVLTEDSSGGSAVFENGNNGILVQLDNVDDLVRGIQTSLARSLEFGRRSAAIVAEKFSWDACAEMTLACYRELAGSTQV